MMGWMIAATVVISIAAFAVAVLEGFMRSCEMRDVVDTEEGWR